MTKILLRDGFKVLKLDIKACRCASGNAGYDDCFYVHTNMADQSLTKILLRDGFKVLKLDNKACGCASGNAGYDDCFDVHTNITSM